MSRWTGRHVRALIRHSGPTSLLFRRRLALMGGAVLVGLAAIAFAWAADEASEAFQHLARDNRWLPLLLTPLGFATLAWITRSAAPSLATGAGFGNLLRWVSPDDQTSAVVLLGMVAYFTGVVRAPLTAVIIISETTGSRGFMRPLLGAALVADWAAQRICKDRLYHGLSRSFLDRARAAHAAEEK